MTQEPSTTGNAPKGARAKLRAYFLANLGRVMDSTELRPVAGNISEWARRVRELRTEEGFLILTHNDRADLKPGEYECHLLWLPVVTMFLDFPASDVTWNL